jgi:colanic acid biosynthesis glycosyl transferase WcaI
MTKETKKGRVLVVGQHFWPETFRVTDLCEGFVEQGYEVDVLCGIPNYPAGKFFKGYGFFKKRRQDYKGVRIIRVPEIPRGNNSNLMILINYLSYPFFALFYIPWLLTRHYDRIFVYQLSPVLMGLPGIVLAKLKKIKIYFFVTDFWPHSFFSVVNVESSWAIRALTNMSYWHYRQADGVVGVFKGIQTRMISEVGLDKEKTLYIPQAPEKIYETEVFDPELQKRFKGKFNIVFAGNINPAQSFDTITEAAKLVEDAGHTEVNYIIIGEGMSKQWLIDEVTKLGICDRFVFEGLKPVEDIPKYQTVANAMIVALSRSPLFEYGIPAKVQSYMAGGRPIVGAMDGAGKDLVNGSGSGICVDSGDARGLADAIIKLAEMKPAEREKMGKRGRDYHFKHFEREQNLHRLIEFVFNDKRIPDTEYGD